MSTCRICLEISSYISSIFDRKITDVKHNISIPTMIALCTGLEISKLDLMPQEICDRCLNDLDIAYNFRKRCWKSTEFLQNLEGFIPIDEDNTKSFPKFEEVNFDEDLIFKDEEEPDIEKEWLNQLNYENNETVVHGKNEATLTSTFEISTLQTNMHPCKFCKKNFLKQDLKRHILIHTGEKPYSCSYCEYRSIRKHSVKSHITKRHPNQSIKINSTLPQTNRNEEKEDIDAKKHVCNICTKNFSKVHYLKMHYRTHTGEKPFSCNYCDYRGNRLYTLRDHMFRRHPTEPNIILSRNPNNLGKIDQKERIPTIVEKNDENKSNPLDSIKEKSRICYMCEHKFKSECDLKKHIAVHTGEKQYNCKYCEFRSNRKHSVRNHIFRKHPNEKNIMPFRSNNTCKICNKFFITKNELRTHAITHTGKKPFSCSFCDYRGTTPILLKVHLRKHTGEAKYVCEECGTKFRCASSLGSHKAIHRTTRPYKCTICSKSFRRSSILKNHMFIHDSTPHYKCSYCDKKFAKKWGLAVHKITHTGKAPHVCRICEKGFIAKTRWRTHMKNFHPHDAIEEKK